MKYKIELIKTVYADYGSIDQYAERVPLYCLYKRGCVLDKWEKIAESINLDKLQELAKTLKGFNTIYL